MINSLFKRMDHVGIVVHSIDESLKTYCELMGFRLLERVVIEEQLVEAAFLDAGNSTIELIAPTDTESGTAKFFEKRGEGTHHICYEVENLEDVLRQLAARGIQLIDETPRQGVHGKVAFIHPKATHGTMIELLQKDQ